MAVAATMASGTGTPLSDSSAEAYAPIAKKPTWPKFTSPVKP